jgi:hypothetical protein
MATSLIQRVQDSVRSQKSNFCSRATSVTLLGDNGGKVPFNLVVSYVDCDGNTTTVPYMEVQQNNNYIPDCVQGGCPISITDGGDFSSVDQRELISDVNVGELIPDGKIPIEPQPTQSYKSFVQYGTTDCEAPPSENNVILQPCNLIGESFIVDPTGYNLTQGGVYNIQLNPINPFGVTPPLQCYTVGGQTGISADYNIKGQVENVGDCNMCKKPTPTVTFPTPTVTFPKPTVTFPTQTPMPPTFFSYIVGDTSFGLQQDACASSGGGTITVYSNSNLEVNSTFLYGDQQLKTPYNSNGFVYYSGKGNYVLSTGSDGKLTSLDPCT